MPRVRNTPGIMNDPGDSPQPQGRDCPKLKHIIYYGKQVTDYV